jgi:hypothetical protein
MNVLGQFPRLVLSLEFLGLAISFGSLLLLSNYFSEEEDSQLRASLFDSSSHFLTQQEERFRPVKF